MTRKPADTDGSTAFRITWFNFRCRPWRSKMKVAPLEQGCTIRLLDSALRLQDGIPSGAF